MGVWRDQEANPALEPWRGLPFFQTDSQGSSPCARILDKLDQEAAGGAQILPEPKNVFRALALTPPEKARVVILGQDPYPTPGDAMGLAFSVAPGVKIPRSLANIFKEMQADLGGAPASGDLSSWAESGALLLNTALTVRAGEAGSHAKLGWSPLVDQVLDLLGRPDSGRVFVLWGAHAQKLGERISPQGNLILASAHPSPLSASRGFFGSKPFSQIDAWLKAQGEPPIRWF